MFAMKNLSPSDELLRKCYVIGMPIATYVVAAMAGTWWLDHNLPRGVAYLVMLYVIAIRFSTQPNLRVGSAAKAFIWIVFIVPTILATAGFLYGLLIRYFGGTT